MIQLTGAGKRFGPKILFEDLNWLITPKERVGIVGANGTGKSTLLKVLAGIEGLDYGSINVMKGIRAGYLPQDGITLTGRTVFDECLSVFDEIHALEAEQQDLAHRMSELDHASPEYQQIAERYHHVQAEFTARDGYNIESRVGAVLSGLGFRREDWQRRVEEFSGGWQMRIALAKLLLEEPNLLLLDEPTNHLDLEARNWLESYLETYPNAFVLISHDRFFLDVTVSRIAEIWNKRVYFYTGGYSKYEQQKTERRAQLEAAYRQSARAHRAAGSVHQPVPRSGDEGQTGAEPDQGTREDRAHRNSAGREDDPLPLSAAEAERTDCGRVPECVEELWREARVLRRVFQYRARRPHRAGGRERGGEVDADQAAVG